MTVTKSMMALGAMFALLPFAASVITPSKGEVERGLIIRVVNPVSESDGKGAGEWAGFGKRALFFQESDQDLVVQDQAGKQLLRADVKLPPTASVVGAGYDLQGSGRRVMFYRSLDASLHAFELSDNAHGVFNVSGEWNFHHEIGVPLTIQSGAIVVGAGYDFRSNGHQSIFIRNADGNLSAVEVATFGPKSGKVSYGWNFTVAGRPLKLEAGWVVVAAGMDLRGSGKPCILLRDEIGQLHGLEIDGDAVSQTWHFANTNVPAGSTFAGATSALRASGQPAFYYRGEGNGLHIAELDIGGDRLSSRAGNTAVVLSDGSRFVLPDDEVVIGAAASSDNASMARLFTRRADGEVSVYDATQGAAVWKVKSRTTLIDSDKRPFKLAISSQIVGDVGLLVDQDQSIVFYQYADGGSLHARLFATAADQPNTKVAVYGWEFVKPGPQNVTIGRDSRVTRVKRFGTGSWRIEFLLVEPDGRSRWISASPDGHVAN